jgi:hypothetical protein
MVCERMRSVFATEFVACHPLTSWIFRMYRVAGHLPQLPTDPENDILFTWNGTTSGVKVWLLLHQERWPFWHPSACSSSSSGMPTPTVADPVLRSHLTPFSRSRTLTGSPRSALVWCSATPRPLCLRRTCRWTNWTL